MSTTTNFTTSHHNITLSGADVTIAVGGSGVDYTFHAPNTDRARQWANIAYRLRNDRADKRDAVAVQVHAVATLAAAILHDEYPGMGPEEAFSATLNDARGMCPDGCCGGYAESGDYFRADLDADITGRVREIRRGAVERTWG